MRPIAISTAVFAESTAPFVTPAAVPLIAATTSAIAIRANPDVVEHQRPSNARSSRAPADSRAQMQGGAARSRVPQCIATLSLKNCHVEQIAGVGRIVSVAASNAASALPDWFACTSFDPSLFVRGGGPSVQRRGIAREAFGVFNELRPLRRGDDPRSDYTIMFVARAHAHRQVRIPANAGADDMATSHVHTRGCTNIAPAVMHIGISSGSR